MYRARRRHASRSESRQFPQLLPGGVDNVTPDPPPIMSRECTRPGLNICNRTRPVHAVRVFVILQHLSITKKGEALPCDALCNTSTPHMITHPSLPSLPSFIAPSFMACTSDLLSNAEFLAPACNRFEARLSPASAAFLYHSIAALRSASVPIPV